MIPVNLHFVLLTAQVSEQEIEDAVLRGWLSTSPSDPEQADFSTHNSEDERKQNVHKLRPADLNQHVLLRADREGLPKVFQINVNALRKLHLLRHSPAHQILNFLQVCVPQHHRIGEYERVFIKFIKNSET